MMPLNYSDMVSQLMGLVRPVGDVIPFGKRNMYPGMGTEGGGRIGNARGEVLPFEGRYDRAANQQSFQRWLNSVVSQFQGQKPELERKLDQLAGKPLPDLLSGPHAETLKGQFRIGTDPKTAAELLHMINSGKIE